MRRLTLASPLLLVVAAWGCATALRGEALKPPVPLTGLPPKVVWTAQAGKGIDVAPNWTSGLLLVATTDRKLEQYDAASGERAWHKRIDGSPAGRVVVVGRTAYAATSIPDAAVYAFDLDEHKVKWRVHVGEPAGDPVVFEGAVLLATQDGTVHGLNPIDGKSIWVTNTENRIWGSTWFDAGKALLFIAGRGGRLMAIDGRSGERRWTQDLGQPLGAVAGDSLRIYVVSGDSTVIAFDPSTGNRIWSTDLHLPIRAAVTPAGDRVIVSGLAGDLVSLGAADGAIGWRLQLGGPFVAPAAVADSEIVVGSPSGLVWSIDTSGAVHGLFRHQEPVLVTPLKVNDLWVVAGERGGIVGCRWEVSG